MIEVKLKEKIISYKLQAHFLKLLPNRLKVISYNLAYLANQTKHSLSNSIISNIFVVINLWCFMKLKWIELRIFVKL
jgi:formate/nitrite transporter FocA (FNT family)